MDAWLIFRICFSVVISFLLTFYFVPLCILMAYRLKILDVPDGKIKQHAKTVPYLGGVAVYIGFVSALAFTLPFYNNLSFFVLGATLLLFIGLVDDLLVLKHYQKFFGQLIAIFCFLKGGLHLKETFFLQSSWTIPLSILWMLSIINAYNLVDVMDGLATSLALWATGTFMILSFIFGQEYIGILLGALFGSLGAFFLYNRPGKATIYLGDAGSLFIGGLLAATPFLFQWGTYNSYGIVIPCIVLAIPLLELTALVVIRTWKRIPFYCASPDHFSIYLMKAGWKKWNVLLYVWFLSSLLLIFTILFSLNCIAMPTLFFVGFCFLLVWIVTIWSNVIYKIKNI